MQICHIGMSLGVLSAVIRCKLRSFLKKQKKTINLSFPSVSFDVCYLSLVLLNQEVEI